MLAAAAHLIHLQGVHGTSVDRVLEASGTGKGQFYHYFGSKDALVREVVAYHANRVMADQDVYLRRLDTWDGIQAWFDYLVAAAEENGCVGGCPIGTLAAEMSDQDESLRSDLARALHAFEERLAEGLACMQARQELRAEADVRELASFVVSTQQGGILMAKTMRDAAALRLALKHTLSYLKSFSRRPVAAVAY